MGNACNFAQDDEEMHFNDLNSHGFEINASRSQSHSIRGGQGQAIDGQSSLMPTKNPLRLEEIEPEMLSNEPGLAYVHELAYSNGAMYRGQIKPVEKLRKETVALAQSQMNMTPIESRNSIASVGLNDQRSNRASMDQRQLEFEKELGLSQSKPGSVAKIYTVDAGKLAQEYGSGSSGVLIQQSPSQVSQGGTRLESFYGDEMDDGSRGVRHGFGVQVWQDGAKYKGQWQNNKAHGKGTFWHADGDYYEGEFRNDKSNGFGVFHCLDGTVYEGIWLDDIQHGQGQAHWPDGSSYIGNYMEGKRHGIGTYKWTNGNSYSGEWNDNTMSGFGTYEWADGRKYSGGWLRGKQHGEAIFTAANGESRKGIWEEGKRTGWVNDYNVGSVASTSGKDSRQQ